VNQSPELRAILNAIPADFADPAADYQSVRKTFEGFHGHPTGSDLQINISTYGGVRCGEYELQGGLNYPIAFHCHGGAFVSTPLDAYHFYAEIIAWQTGCRIVMPDYRLAPEHPWPAAPDDCFQAYVGLLESGISPSAIVLFGESCGGSLALALLRTLRDKNLPMPSCFISLTGWFDLSVAGRSSEAHDPFLTAEWVRNRGLDYTGGALPLDDPAVSPAYADLSGLPPLYLQIGQYDTVREGALTLGARALQDGVDVLMESWPGMVHGWHGLVNAGVPEAAAAWAAIRRYIESTHDV
jgi:acetyl esterase/lipase